MTGLYYRTMTSELIADGMEQENDLSILDGVPNYLLPDPLSAERPKRSSDKNKTPTKPSKPKTQRSASQGHGTKQEESRQTPKKKSNGFLDLNDDDDFTNRPPAPRWYPYTDDLAEPNEAPYDPTNWDWLRLDALGPGWLQALKEVPVNRREALNLLIIMKKKLLRAASELTFFKERVTILQDQLIHQKRNEEKFIRLRSAYEAQAEELVELRETAAKVPGLQKAVRQQEELITRLESYLDRKRSEDINCKLTKKDKDLNIVDANIFDQISPSPQFIPNTTDLAAAEALRNLSSENENLRQTLSELSQTVRNLAQQQQLDSEHHHQAEQKYKEELEALREQQRHLEDLQAMKNKHLDQLASDKYKSDFAESERIELYRMLDNAEMRIKTLEEELEMREGKPFSYPTTYGPNRRPTVLKEPLWKYPGPSKTAPQRFPPVTNNRKKPARYSNGNLGHGNLNDGRYAHSHSSLYSNNRNNDWLNDSLSEDANF